MLVAVYQTSLSLYALFTLWSFRNAIDTEKTVEKHYFILQMRWILSNKHEKVVNVETGSVSRQNTCSSARQMRPMLSDDLKLFFLQTCSDWRSEIPGKR